jgi:hypothetical protein
MPDDPKAFGCRRRVRGDHDAATLRPVGRAIPADDEPVLRGQEIGAFVEIDEVPRITLKTLFVVLMLAACELDQARTKSPALHLAVAAFAMPENLGDAIDELQRVFVDPAEDEASLMRRQCEAETEVGLTAAALSAVKQFVGSGVIGVALWSPIRHPGRFCSPLASNCEELLPGLRRRLLDQLIDDIVFVIQG